MNLKNKFPKYKLKAIGIKVRTNIINKKKDKTFIMDKLSKKSFNLIIEVHLSRIYKNIYLFKFIYLNF